MQTVGSEAGELSGHDVRRWLAGVARSASMAALTYAADNVAGLGLSPLQVLILSQVLSAAIDILRRKHADTRVVPVEPAK